MTGKQKILTSVVTDNSIIETLYCCLSKIHRRIKKVGLENERDDIVQEIAIVLLNQSRKTVIDSPEAYLFGVTKKIISKHCKERAESHLSSLSEEEFLKCRKAFDDDSALNEELKKHYRYLYETILEAMEIHLSPEQTQIMKKRFLEGYSYEEIAQEFGKTVVNIRQIISRARKKIKNLLYK